MKTFGAKSAVTITQVLSLILLASLQNISAGLSFLSTTNSVGHAPSFVTAADVNGDGRLDLICANYNDDTLTVLTNNSGGVFGSNATVAVGKRPGCVIAADIRGSGKVDLICANYEYGGGKTLTILTNNGSGIFGSNTTLTAGIGPYWVIAADLKGIGKLDLVTANAGTNGNGTTLTIFTNNGSGILSSNVALTVGSAPDSVAAADVNGDGKLDLICANDLGNSLTVLTNKGNGTFLLKTTIAVGVGPGSVIAADVNGDGKADLISANLSASTLTVVTNTGNGGFVISATLSLPTLSSIPALPTGVAAIDLNGDGKVDLVSANSHNGFLGSLSVFTNNSSYRFGSNATVIVGAFPNCVAVADVNADGKPDLISANQDANSLTVLKNTNVFPASVSTPTLSIKLQNNFILSSWPSVSPGWSLQENLDLTKTNWLPSGYAGFPIYDDGTNKSFSLRLPSGSRYFRVLHP